MPPARHVILFLGDGVDPEAWALTRWVRGRPLAVDSILTGANRTYGTDSLITDSAAGATAYATGIKTSSNRISMGPSSTSIEGVPSDPNLAHVPLPTILEGARLAGYATGLVVTSNVQHASPAAFSAHVPHRDEMNRIAEQQVYQGMDLVLGGGTKYLLPSHIEGGARTDGEDLREVLKNRGVALVTTRQQLLAAPAGPLFGLFAPSSLEYELDRPRSAPEQPSLSEMTAVALSRLAATNKAQTRGLFLFVEGSKIDWAAHDNDPVGVVSELGAFDDAVAVALEFASTHPETQVLVVSDHATGGMSIGRRSEPSYRAPKDDVALATLRRAKATAGRMERLISGVASTRAIQELLAGEWGQTDLRPAVLRELLRRVRGRQSTLPILTELLSRAAGIGWSTNGHTGADTYLFAWGPQRPTGLVENSEIGSGAARFLGIDLLALRQELFVPLGAALVWAGYRVQIDQTDPKNGVMVVSKGARSARLPFDHNELVLDDRSITLPGLIVYVKERDEVFGPREALEQIKKHIP